MIRQFAFILFFFASINELAAQMPNTNIVIFDYVIDSDSFIVKNHLSLTSDSGYNNQPSFSKDCKSVYYSTNKTDSLNTEIFAYDIRRSKHSRVTNTMLSEYSPIEDLYDNNAIYHVRVESDRKQQLRKYNRKNATNENICFASDSVGYYALTNYSVIGLIILNNGLEFHTYLIGDSSSNLVKTNTGRFLNYDKTRNSFWFHGHSATGDLLYRYDINKNAIVDSIPALVGCKDYGIDNNGNLLGSSHGELFRFGFSKNRQWIKTLDLKNRIDDFYRLSFCSCGNHFCVVTYRGDKP